jgi:PPE-repeat protein
VSETPDLVAHPEPEVTNFKGAGILDSGESLFRHLKVDDGEDLDAFAVAMDGVSVGLDMLSFAMNPLGELVKAGVGWLLENVDFIREPLDLLTGNPDLVMQAAQTWNNIAAELEAVAGDYEGALSSTSGWEGDAAIAYRRLAMEYTSGLHDVAAQAKESARWITTGGMVVATARAIIFDIIATFISDVITRALLALASSWFTLGGSLAAFTASVFAEAALIMAKIQKKIGKLLGAIQRFVKKFNLMGDKTAEVATTLGRKSSELGYEAKKAIKASEKAMKSLAPDVGTAKKYADYIAGNGTGPLARTVGKGTVVGDIVGSDGTRLAKEAGKAAAGNYDQYTGGNKESGQVNPRSGTISGSLDDGE